MADYTRTVLVGVFGQRLHAERATADLRAGGYADADLGVLWAEAGSTRGAGAFPPAAGADSADLLAGLGVGAEEAAYYRSEVDAGRCLLVVATGREGGAARAAVGRNCGSFRLPPPGVLG